MIYASLQATSVEGKETGVITDYIMKVIVISRQKSCLGETIKLARIIIVFLLLMIDSWVGCLRGYNGGRSDDKRHFWRTKKARHHR